MGLQLKKIGQIPASLGGSVASQKEKPYLSLERGLMQGGGSSEVPQCVVLIVNVTTNHHDDCFTTDH